MHRRDEDAFLAHLDQAKTSLAEAQELLQPFPAVMHAGFLHDAEKEYAEAVLTRALVSGDPLPAWSDIAVAVPAWLNGLAEAASELRRNLLDRMRAGESGFAEELLTRMDEVYDLLVTVDYPDALTGGLRRSTDALRAVLERSRSDVTLSVLQGRLRETLERRAIKEDSGGR